MRFDILTIFPNFFSGPFDHGILSRAIGTGAVEVQTHDLRVFTHDRHRTVDDRPFGGGEGMVLKAQPIFDCVESLGGIAAKAERDLSRQSVILLSAQGKRFTQDTAHRLASLERVVLICGRYEGVDERVCELLADEELSIGDYVLSGGELAAAVMLDATVRLLPGVLGHADSSRYESFGAGDDPADSITADGVPRSTHGAGGILDYPHYTRPAEFRGVAVPEVLGGGDHAAIRRWRRQMALEKTWRNRPDLLEKAQLSADDQRYLSDISEARDSRPMCLGFDPVSAKDARVLILGTLPGEESLAANEYYANKRNAFWWIMGELVGAHPDLPYQSRLELLRKKGFALWDVCKSAERQGSLDAKIIKNTVETNDFDSFLREHPQLKAIIFNGQDAEKLFRRSQFASSTWVSHVEKHTLDSTSPTNTISKTEKLRRWRDSLATYL